MPRIFDNTRPATLILLFVSLTLISSFSLYIYFNNIDIQTQALMGPYLKGLGSISLSVLSLLLVISLGVLVNFIVHDNGITRNNTYALLFFVLLIGSNYLLSVINPVLVSTFFVVLALKSLLSLHEHREMTQKLFNSGFLLGIAAIIYPYSILYVVLIFLGIIIYGADNWRQWFIPILGIALPYYILFAWYFWFDKLDVFSDKYFIESFSLSGNFLDKSVWAYVIWGVFIFLTIFSILDYIKNMNSHKLDARKGYAMTFLSLIIGIVITLAGTVRNGQELIIIFFPVAIIWAKFIQHQKKALFRTIFILAVILNSVLSFILHQKGL